MRESKRQRESIEGDRSQLSILSMLSSSKTPKKTPDFNRQASQAESSVYSHKFEVEHQEERLIILLDMDAYYA